MKDKIRLGDKVKDKYTGFKGIAIAKTEFINGCVQFIVVSKYDKQAKGSPDGMPPEMPIDEQSLVLVDKKLRKPSVEDIKKEAEAINKAEETLDELETEEEDTGGPSKVIKRRNY